MNATPPHELPGDRDEVVLRPSTTVLNSRAAEAVYERLSELEGGSGSPRLSLDLSGVEYLSRAVLYRLLDMGDRLRAAGGDLRLGNIGPDRLAALRDVAA
jgi:anti-anti-sigma regulatory factor